MAEVLTESFCERCGTRYTFESAKPRVKRLSGVKVLSRGLKNFVLSDDSSLDEAMAAARSDTDREVTSQQLDAFHKTFNFCMTCRQYTCANCWNEAEGACLTCEPHLGHEIMPAPFPDLDPRGMTVALAATDVVAPNGLTAANGTNGHGSNGTNEDTTSTPAPALNAGAWPTGDAWPSYDASADAPAADELPTAASATGEVDGIDEIDVAARMAALAAIGSGLADPAEIEPGIEADAQAAEPVPMPVDATSTTPPPVRSQTTAEVAAATAAQTAALLNRFRPGQDLDAAIDAYEREAAAVDVAAPELEPEPLAAAELPANAAIVGLEPDVAAADPEPEPDVQPVAADREAELAATAAAAIVASRHTDVVAQPTWQIVAPDVGPATTPVPPVAPPAVPASPPAATAAQPAWPADPQWPSQRPAGGLPFLGRLAQPTGGLESLWAESNREVVAATPTPGRPVPTGVQPCVSCGLSLSATARFCRRCGTLQG